MPTLAAYFHDLSPVVFSIAGDFAVRWYGLSYVAGFLVAWWVMRSLARRGLIQIPPERVSDAMMVIIFGTLVGGRLGYALVYDPALFTGWSAAPPYWSLLAIQKGGMASHGGMVGIILGCWYVSRGYRAPDGTILGRTSTLHVMDIMGAVSCFGLFMGRFANFINGELLGKIVAGPGEPAPWWSVRFPQELLGWYKTSAGELVRSAASHAPELSDAQLRTLDQLVTSIARPSEGWNSALAYVVSHPGRYRAVIEPLLSARHPSQIYQMIAEGLVLGVVTWWLWRLPRKPGFIAGWWLMLYGVLRVLTELWRLPDAQFVDNARPMGLSRGQWLSVAMVVAGGVLAAWSTRGKERLGGWWSGCAGPQSAN